MLHSHIVLSRPAGPDEEDGREKPGFLLAFLLVVLPIALLYASDVQGFFI